MLRWHTSATRPVVKRSDLDLPEQRMESLLRQSNLFLARVVILDTGRTQVCYSELNMNVLNCNFRADLMDILRSA